MNIGVYVFGEFEKGYTQFPNDYTSGIFKKFKEYSKATTQITIHRDKDLMYYGYIRLLENGRYIGICAVLNSEILSNTNHLFSIFEDVFAGIVERGDLIHYDSRQSLVTSVEQLHLNQEDVDKLTNELRAAFSGLEKTSLPPVDYSKGKDSFQNFTSDEDPEKIFHASYRYGYTLISKATNFDSPKLNSFKSRISELEQEISDNHQQAQQLIKQLTDTQSSLEAAQAEINHLSSENASLKEQEQNRGSEESTVERPEAEEGKKNNNWSTIFFIGFPILVIVAICAYNIGKSQGGYDSTPYITDTDTVMVENDEIKDQYNKLSQKYNKLCEIVKANSPVIGQSVEIANQYYDGRIETDFGRIIDSNNTMYLVPKLKCYSIGSQTCKFSIKLYANGSLRRGDSSPSGCTFQDEKYLTDGMNEIKFSGWGNDTKGFWSRGNYRYEIWLEGKLIFSKQFKVF